MATDDNNDATWNQFLKPPGRCFSEPDPSTKKRTPGANPNPPGADGKSDNCCQIPDGSSINVEGELKPGGLAAFDTRPLNEKVDDYCGSVMTGKTGPGERAERANDAIEAFSCGMANLIGMGGLLRKTLNTERGGSPNYVDQPTELIKSMTDKLRQTRDRAFYISMCNEYLADERLMNAADQLHSLVNLEITELNNLVQFEVKSLMLVEMCASMCLLSIIVYLLLITPKKKI
jgi:hypothetical protein